MSAVKNLALNENISWILKGECTAIENEKILSILDISSIALNVIGKLLFL